MNQKDGIKVTIVTENPTEFVESKQMETLNDVSEVTNYMIQLILKEFVTNDKVLVTFYQ